ncbi:DUF1997 domain-containing protein [Mastigocladus laminosus UU774]|nr:hypothetical protein B4U84_13375 [Westiellopsis prolifica IICB1]TFI53482.1 DUF1997 domain-containing protein [Mastigocladus laminosus UU774]
MLSRNKEYQSVESFESLESTEVVLSVASLIAENEVVHIEKSVGTTTMFCGRYQDKMEMYASADTVAEYLNNHASWFSRCAEPMKVEPLGENGYALVIGRFGSFGYEVEPKIGLELLPPEDHVYRIRTVPIPDYQAPGYEVDYNSSLQLIEIQESSITTISSEITTVEWELDLKVYINFPKFIQRLPKSLVQSTGDRVLHQIIRQVSRRLTRKVQEDFHQSLGIELPANVKKNK